MKSVVCTLYEGHYQYGVAALTNSLYKNGFRGDICVGFRGSLPSWSSSYRSTKDLAWQDSTTFHIKDDLRLHFLPVITKYHLTNYKAEFMLKLLAGVAKEAEYLAYFDPDIVVKCKWSFFEQWMDHGVAIVHEIMANDMPPTHPIRGEWEKTIVKSNKRVVRQLNSYINGGFCGVARKHEAFIKDWDDLMNTAIDHFGLLPDKFMPYDRTHPYYASDQDTLNVAAMCSETPISVIGPEGMDFIHGGWIMSHAVGSPKPWKKKFIKSIIEGRPPSLADKEFWLNVEGPIVNHNSLTISYKKLSISIASFISRFYHRH